MCTFLSGQLFSIVTDFFSKPFPGGFLGSTWKRREEVTFTLRQVLACPLVPLLRGGEGKLVCFQMKFS